MSRIYFHTQTQTVNVSGSERYHMASYCSDLFQMALGLTSEWDAEHKPSRFRRIVNPSHYCLTSPDFIRSLRTALSVGMDSSLLQINGEDVDIFSVSLTTAILLGSDPVKLMARLHGQCGIHCYVEAENRKWLAGIIQQGYDDGIFREGVGWSKVINLLQDADDSPVVTSYSVTDSFPNESIGKAVMQSDDSDEWDSLPEDQQWARAMEGLRRANSDSTYNLEIKPETWANYYFGDGQSAYDILRHLQELDKERN